MNDGAPARLEARRLERLHDVLRVQEVREAVPEEDPLLGGLVDLRAAARRLGWRVEEEGGGGVGRRGWGGHRTGSLSRYFSVIAQSQEAKRAPGLSTRKISLRAVIAWGSGGERRGGEREAPRAEVKQTPVERSEPGGTAQPAAARRAGRGAPPQQPAGKRWGGVGDPGWGALVAADEVRRVAGGLELVRVVEGVGLDGDLHEVALG